MKVLSGYSMNINTISVLQILKALVGKTGGVSVFVAIKILQHVT
jgi:hypothetical protein